MTVADLSAATRSRLEEAVAGGFPSTVADLGALVRIPSVSWDGFDQTQVQRSAEAVAALLGDLGVFEQVRIERARQADGELGRPAVLATRRAAAGRPTVLLYAHHDVQPPGDDADWATAPFEPTLVGERLHGRGAADDKAGVMTHVAAIRALTEALGAEPQVGIVAFVEGEEEWGSQSFKDFIVAHREALAADAIIVADSGNWDTATPAITVGLRGNVTFVMTLRTLDHASHSGMFGGAVPDAPMAAIRLLSTLWDEDGVVAVPGLTSRQAPTPDYDEAQLRAETGLLPGASPIGRDTILSRIWDKPAITVTGMDLPSVVNASNTLTPVVRVKVSVRIAPGQRAEDAYEAVRAHLIANAPWGAELAFGELQLGDPFLVDTAAPLFGVAKDAMAAAWGREAVEQGVGGSIPFIAELVEVFPAAQILITGVEDPDSRAHSPNESLHLPTFRRAILAESLFLAALDGRGVAGEA